MLETVGFATRGNWVGLHVWVVGRQDCRDERGERGERGVSSYACTDVGVIGQNLGAVRGFGIIGIWHARGRVRNRLGDKIVVAGTLVLII